MAISNAWITAAAVLASTARVVGSDPTPVRAVQLKIAFEEATAAPTGEPKPKRGRRSRPGGIKSEIDGVVVRVERGAEAGTVSRQLSRR